MTDWTPAARQDADRIGLLTRSPSGSGRRGATRHRPHQAPHTMALMCRTARRDKTPTASGSTDDRPHVQDGAARQATDRIRLFTRSPSCAGRRGATRRRPHRAPHALALMCRTVRRNKTATASGAPYDRRHGQYHAGPMTLAASHSPHLRVHRGLDVERQEHQQPPVRPEIAGGT